MDITIKESFIKRSPGFEYRAFVVHCPPMPETRFHTLANAAYYYGRTAADFERIETSDGVVIYRLKRGY